jgi:hypothetical protein
MVNSVHGYYLRVPIRNAKWLLQQCGQRLILSLGLLAARQPDQKIKETIDNA